MAATTGYWLVASDGGVFAFGDAAFYGSTGNIHLAKPVVGIAPTPTGKGYWMAAADGGIFNFGDAVLYGSLPGLHVHVDNIVGISATPTGKGYYLVASDGGVFAFGDAVFDGSEGGKKLNKPVVGIAVCPLVMTPPPPTLPVIESVQPMSGEVGAQVIITGSHLSGATVVKFGGVVAQFKINSDSEIQATVPPEAGALTTDTTEVE